MFMITIIYNYILYTLKEYLQKKKNGSTSSLCMSHQNMEKKRIIPFDSLKEFEQCRPYSKYEDLKLSCYNQLQCIVSYFYITPQPIKHNPCQIRVLSYLKLPETTEWYTNK